MSGLQSSLVSLEDREEDEYPEGPHAIGLVVATSCTLSQCHRYCFSSRCASCQVSALLMLSIALCGPPLAAAR